MTPFAIALGIFCYFILLVCLADKERPAPTSIAVAGIVTLFGSIWFTVEWVIILIHALSMSGGT